MNPRRLSRWVGARSAAGGPTAEFPPAVCRFADRPTKALLLQKEPALTPAAMRQKCSNLEH